MARPARLCRFPGASPDESFAPALRRSRFRAARIRAVPGVSAAGSLVSVVAGVGAVCEDNGARSAPSGRGRAGGGPGEPGNRALGVPGFPRFLAGFRVRQVRRGMRGRCRALSPAISAARCVVWGGRNGGLGENLEPGRVFAGPGGVPGVPPVIFNHPSLLLFAYRAEL